MARKKFMDLWPTNRRIGGEMFRLATVHKTKRNAQHKAQQFRKPLRFGAGVRARVIGPIANRSGGPWAVYIRR